VLDDFVPVVLPLASLVVNAFIFEERTGERRKPFHRPLQPAAAEERIVATARSIARGEEALCLELQSLDWAAPHS